MQLSDWQREFSRTLKASGPVETGIAVYRDGYWSRIFAALAGDFPVLRRFLGAFAFEALIREFLLRPRPFQPDLSELSATFAEFVVVKFPGTRAARSALLENAARESAWLIEAHSARPLALHSSARLLSWQERRYLVWRASDGVETVRLSEGEFVLLDCLAVSASLDEALQNVTALSLSPAFVKRETAAWVAAGLLSGFAG